MIPKTEMRVYPGLVKDIVRTVLAEEVGKGAYLKLFSLKLAEFLGVKYAIPVPCDSAGISILLAGMGLGPDDEVIMPAYRSGFVSRISARENCTAKFVDVEGGSFNIDPDLIVEAITTRSKAVVASHMFGLPCDIEKIRGIARNNGLKVIEDCTHSPGALSGVRRTGFFGDAAYFSLASGGLLNALGGGVIVTGDEGLAGNIQAMAAENARSSPKFPSSLRFLRKAGGVLTRRLLTDKILSGLGIPAPEWTEPECARFTNLQALIGIKQLTWLDKNNSLRAEAARRYDRGLGGSLAAQRCALAGQRVYHRYVVNLPAGQPDLDKIQRRARASGFDIGIRGGILTGAGLPVLPAGNFPVSARLYETNIALPIFDGLRLSDCDRIISGLAGAL